MSTSLPAFQRPCLAAAGAGSTSVYLAGVSSTVQGRLEVYRVNINNINSPTATMIGSVTNATFWSYIGDKYCDTFSADRTSPAGPPLMIQQFGELSTATAMFYANGTLIDHYPNNSKKVSYKLFAPTGASGNYNWYTCMASKTDNTTFSPWMGLQYYDAPTAGGTFDYFLATYPSASALLAVGTFQPSSVSPATGYISVFDKTSGTVYSASSLIKYDELNRVQTLSSPFTIKMNDIMLTSDAYPVTMGSTGYIVDRAADGGTVLYTITPSSGAFELKAVSVKGDVPPFYTYRGSTAVGTQLVLYGGMQGNGNPSTSFHLYDTVSNEWSGPGLIKQTNPPSGGNGNGGSGDNNTGGNKGSSGGGSNTGAIVGGIVGGLVVLALLGFLLFRRHKRKNSKANAIPVTPSSAGAQPHETHQLMHQTQHDINKVPPSDMPYPPYQAAFPPNVGAQQQPYTLPPAIQPQQAQQPQYYHPPQLLPQQPNASFHSAQYPMSSTPATTATIYQPQHPQVFSPPPPQPQQPHSYIPPTLTTLDSLQPQHAAGTTGSVPPTPVETTAPSSASALSLVASQAGAYSPTNYSYSPSSPGTTSNGSQTGLTSSTTQLSSHPYHSVITSIPPPPPNNPQYIPPGQSSQ